MDSQQIGLIAAACISAFSGCVVALINRGSRKEIITNREDGATQHAESQEALRDLSADVRDVKTDVRGLWQVVRDNRGNRERIEKLEEKRDTSGL